ncbi:MAG: hypothetical protein M1812_001246 [Candelaria pacifica]|nr:MAG: hypothetical protein M1812_001246 [Candelaria pacifica]
MHITFVSVLAILSGTALAQGPPSLTKLLSDNKNLTKFNSLIQEYGDIYATLSFSRDITILAPSNDAFDKIPYSSLASAFSDNKTDIIRSVLDLHVLNGTHSSGSLNSTAQFLATWLDDPRYSNVTGGQTIQIVKQSGNDIVTVSGLGSRSSLSTTDLQFSGGIVHVIDTFLVPPKDFISTAPSFNLTAAGGAVTKAKLNDYLDTSKDVTIFAPSNAAFQGVGSALVNMTTEELGKVLDYHVVSGTIGYSPTLTNGTILKTLQGGNLTITFASNSLYVNSAKFLQQDIILSNGILHVIDNLLDYNATAVQPNPQIPTQPPILQGTSVADTPFSSDLPTTVTSVATSIDTSAPTDGSMATSTDASAASSTTDADSASATSSKKKSDAANIGCDRTWGALIGGAVFAVLAL